MAGLAIQPQPTTIPEMWDAWCARCHAKDGSGKVDEPTIKVVPMDFTDCSLTTPEPDSDWILAIASGGPAVGLSSEMPAFGDALTAQQVQEFVRHAKGFCREAGWPSGNLNFPRPIFTEKAFPEDELVLLPFVTHRKSDIRGDIPVPPQSLIDFDFLAVFERRFGRRGMWEVTLPVSSHDRAGFSRRQGIGDVELAAKYVLATSSTRPLILSAGLEVSLPTGSEVRALGAGTPIFEPFLSWGAMAGGFYLQGQTTVELPSDSERAEREFVYRLYAGRDASMAPNTWTLGVELTGEDKEVALTPQVRKGLTKTGAIGAAIGVRVPLNERREQGTSVVGYVLWEYREPVRARP
jgi:hypothetical protein